MSGESEPHLPSPGESQGGSNIPRAPEQEIPHGADSDRPTTSAGGDSVVAGYASNQGEWDAAYPLSEGRGSEPFAAQVRAPYIPDFGARTLPPEFWREPVTSLADQSFIVTFPHVDDPHGFESYDGFNFYRDEYLLCIAAKDQADRTPLEREYWLLYQIAFTAQVSPPPPFDRVSSEERIQERYRLAEALYCTITSQMNLYRELTGQDFHE